MDTKVLGLLSMKYGCDMDDWERWPRALGIFDGMDGMDGNVWGFGYDTAVYPLN